MTNCVNKQKRNIYIGATLLVMSALCIAMTIMFVYVSEKSDQRVESIRQDYREVANRRDQRVDELADKVSQMQLKLGALPEQTANKTADAVKHAVAESDRK